MSFTDFKVAIQRKFNEMKAHDLFRVDLIPAKKLEKGC